MSNRLNRPRYTSDRVDDQFGFLMNKNYPNSGGRSNQVKPSKEIVDANRVKAADFLGKYIGKPLAGAADFFTGNRFDFDKQGANPVITPPTESTTKDKTSDSGRTLLSENQLLDRIDSIRQKDLLQQTGIREFELGRAAQRYKSLARDMAEMTDVYAQTAADRRLMEDRSSPTKISQQILRARQGEAALMNAIANQGNTAVNISTAGLAPRGRAGGR